MKMNFKKISTTLTVTLSSILIASFILMFLLNTLILPHYYFSKMEDKVSQVMTSIKALPDTKRTTDALNQLENTQQVTILKLKNDPAHIDEFNEALNTQLNRKRIALNRFWITEDTLNQLQKSPSSIQRNFDQGKQKSSFLVEMAMIKDTFYLVGVSTVDFTETVEIINTFNLISLSVTLLIIIVLIYFSAKKITDPLVKLKTIAEEISTLTFVTTTDIPSNEIGELAISINKMSHALARYQQNLLATNKQLKQFTADLTHELKTPIAVIKAYGSGIEDGLDDGTYLSVILQQTQRLNEIVDQMLTYAKLESQPLQKTSLQLSECWNQSVMALTPMMKKEQLLLLEAKTDHPLPAIEADPALIKRVFDNLLTNSIKYTTDKEIQVTWRETATLIEFSISNQTNLPTGFDVDKLWEAFYVYEKSRNKDLSGTGLGLPIVKSIMEEHGFSIEAKLVHHLLVFTLTFHKNETKNR
ncbi:sensor histidine kinase [Carnobacterium divergens]|nr:sensor histidine kinase [Carnobacterium divergens]